MNKDIYISLTCFVLLSIGSLGQSKRDEIAIPTDKGNLYGTLFEDADVVFAALTITGSTDIQVTVSNAETLHDSAEKGLTIVDGMNHVLKRAPADLNKNLATYNNPDLPLAEGLVQAIKNFIYEL